MYVRALATTIAPKCLIRTTTPSRLQMRGGYDSSGYDSHVAAAGGYSTQKLRGWRCLRLQPPTVRLF
jgi:hypothetical protein